jgi:hypothetical protein
MFRPESIIIGSLQDKIAEFYAFRTVHCNITIQGVKKSLCAPDDYSTSTVDILKMAITEHIRNVDRAVLNTVFENTVRRVNKCLETGGGTL